MLTATGWSKVKCSTPAALTSTVRYGDCGSVKVNVVGAWTAPGGTTRALPAMPTMPPRGPMTALAERVFEFSHAKRVAAGDAVTAFGSATEALTARGADGAA